MGFSLTLVPVWPWASYFLSICFLYKTKVMLPAQVAVLRFKEDNIGKETPLLCGTSYSQTKKFLSSPLPHSSTVSGSGAGRFRLDVEVALG